MNMGSRSNVNEIPDFFTDSCKGAERMTTITIADARSRAWS
jgi:hypothetical protein